MTDTSKPAFARPPSSREGLGATPQPSMILWDCLSGRALAGLCANSGVNMPHKTLAEMVVEHADAMIEELNK